MASSVTMLAARVARTMFHPVSALQRSNPAVRAHTGIASTLQRATLASLASHQHTSSEKHFIRRHLHPLLSTDSPTQTPNSMWKHSPLIANGRLVYVPRINETLANTHGQTTVYSVPFEIDDREFQLRVTATPCTWQQMGGDPTTTVTSLDVEVVAPYSTLKGREFDCEWLENGRGMGVLLVEDGKERDVSKWVHLVYGRTGTHSVDSWWEGEGQSLKFWVYARDVAREENYNKLRVSGAAKKY